MLIKNCLLNIALAQINFSVGNIEENTAVMVDYARKALIDGANLIIFPELCLIGYPADDVLWRHDIKRRVQKALKQLASAVPEIDMVVGYPEHVAEKLYNASAFISNGKIIAKYRKQCLPNFDVFDEQRYFTAAKTTCIFDWHGIKTCLLICEDLWHAKPMQNAYKLGAELVIAINASPFERDKSQQRLKELRLRIQDSPMHVIYVNYCGGQDEIVFDGGSFVMDNTGQVRLQAEFFKQQLIQFELNQLLQTAALTTLPDETALVYQALVLGVRDYLQKNGALGALLGLSGGVDSALATVIAADAIGSDKVMVLLMPSQYTAKMSIEDAISLANNLKIAYKILPITDIYQTYLQNLDLANMDVQVGVTAQNIQSRIRGNLLMAWSNQTGKWVLTTGNKSETAVGYSTLYGDTAGAFNVLKDLTKTWVYRLVEYRNQLSTDIPVRIIQRPPTAELAPNQMDQDSLPPYDLLDQILECYIEQDLSQSEIVALGYDLAIVKRIIKMIDYNEYKRRQTPPGVKVTAKSFGRGRRYPITGKY